MRCTCLPVSQFLYVWMADPQAHFGFNVSKQVCDLRTGVAKVPNGLPFYGRTSRGNQSSHLSVL